MADNSKKKSQEMDLVTVAFADSMSEAKELESLLRNNDIPAVVREQTDEEKSDVYAVMIPEDYLDEATVIIDSKDAYEDFYEHAVDREDSFDDDEDDYGQDF